MLVIFSGRETDQCVTRLEIADLLEHNSDADHLWKYEKEKGHKKR